MLTVVLYVAWWVVPPLMHLKLNDRLEVRLCSLIFCQMALSHKLFVSFTWVTTGYIWEWHFPVSDLSLRGVAHRGHWWLASARASVVPEMQSSLLAPGIPWDTGLTKEGRRPRGKSQGCAGTSTISCFRKVQRLCHCRWGRAGTRVRVPQLLEGWGLGSGSTAAPLPVSMDTVVVEWMELCVQSFLLLWIFSRSGLHCYGQRAVCTETLSVVPSVPPPLCDPIHLPLEVQLCGILRHPVVLGRGTFVGLWVF